MGARHVDRSGFSLLEVMVGCTVIGITLAVAVPNMRSYRESQRVWSKTQQVAAVTRAAQARARSENHSVIVEYHPADGEFVVVDDENSNGVADDGEEVRVHPIGTGLRIDFTTFTNDQLIFDGRGRATNGGTVRIAADRDDIHPKELVVSAGTGHIRIAAAYADVMAH